MLAPRVIIMWVFVLTVSVMVMVRERPHDLYLHARQVSPAATHQVKY